MSDVASYAIPFAGFILLYVALQWRARRRAEAGRGPEPQPWRTQIRWFALAALCVSVPIVLRVTGVVD